MHSKRPRLLEVLSYERFLTVEDVAEVLTDLNKSQISHTLAAMVREGKIEAQSKFKNPGQGYRKINTQLPTSKQRTNALQLKRF